MKKIKKLTAVISALVLLLSCFSLLASAAEAPLKLLALGDSIAWGDGIRNSEEACYARIVADTNGYEYANQAVNGITSWNFLTHLQDEAVQQDILDADIIDISIGGNDFLQQNLPLLILRVAMGNYKNIDDITESLAENYAEAIDTIRALNPDAVILAQTLYNPRVDALREIYGLAVDRVNECIFGYAEENPGAIRIVDVRPVFEGRFDYIAIDTIHPSASGNVAVAELLLQTLFEMGLGENTEPLILTPGIDKLPYSSDILGFFRAFYLSLVARLGALLPFLK